MTEADLSQIKRVHQLFDKELLLFEHVVRSYKVNRWFFSCHYPPIEENKSSRFHGNRAQLQLFFLYQEHELNFISRPNESRRACMIQLDLLAQENDHRNLTGSYCAEHLVLQSHY